MKELLLQLTGYNHWANETLANSMESLPDSMLHEELPGSFTSIHKTWQHLLYAERIWWNRLLRHEKQTTQLPETVEADTKTIIAELLQQSADWHQYVINTTPEELNALFAFVTKKGLAIQQPLHEAVMHLCMHGAYHRGQLVTQLHQCGVHTIPQTDLLIYQLKLQSS